MSVTQQELLEAFEYRDGYLYRRTTGKRVGTRHHTGYLQISFKKKLYNAHRMIFLMHHGWLSKVIDHIDADRSNDRIENLRPATWVQNLQNMRMRSSNTSGVKNVCWCKIKKKWTVQLNVNKRYKFIGRFDDLELAELVAIEAREKYHGTFARHA